MYETLLRRHIRKIATLTLNRRQKKRHLGAMISELQSRWTRLKKIHARVGTSDGERKAFSAGWTWKCSRRSRSNRPRKTRKTRGNGENVPAASGVFKPLDRGSERRGARWRLLHFATLCDFTLAVPEAKLATRK